MEMKVAAGSGGGGPRPRLDVSTIEVMPMSEDQRARIKSTCLTVQTNIMWPPDVKNPMDGCRESPVPATTVVHHMTKSESNLLSVSCAFGDYD